MPGRLDRKLKGAAVGFSDKDARWLATNRGGMGKRLSYQYGAHLGRLAAQQPIAEPDLPEAVLKTNDDLLHGHDMPPRPASGFSFSL